MSVQKSLISAEDTASIALLPGISRHFDRYAGWHEHPTFGRLVMRRSIISPRRLVVASWVAHTPSFAYVPFSKLGNKES